MWWSICVTSPSKYYDIWYRHLGITKIPNDLNTFWDAVIVRVFCWDNWIRCPDPEIEMSSVRNQQIVECSTLPQKTAENWLQMEVEPARRKWHCTIFLKLMVRSRRPDIHHSNSTRGSKSPETIQTPGVESNYRMIISETNPPSRWTKSFNKAPVWQTQTEQINNIMQAPSRTA